MLMPLFLVSDGQITKYQVEYFCQVQSQNSNDIAHWFEGMLGNDTMWWTWSWTHQTHSIEPTCHFWSLEWREVQGAVDPRGNQHSRLTHKESHCKVTFWEVGEHDHGQWRGCGGVLEPKFWVQDLISWVHPLFQWILMLSENEEFSLKYGSQEKKISSLLQLWVCSLSLSL